MAASSQAHAGEEPLCPETSFFFLLVSVGMGAQRLAQQHIGGKSAFLATLSEEAD